MRVCIFLLLALDLLGASKITVTVSPTVSTTSFLHSVTLPATVKGKGGAEGVMWSTSAGTLIGATSGSSSVTFIPPMACGVATVIAMAKADPSKSATAKITVIEDQPLSVQSPKATVQPGQSIQLSAQGGCPGKF